MKSTLKLLSTSISSVIALGFMAATPSTASALTWYDGGAGVWDNTTNNWGPGGTSPWSNNGSAVFAGAGETVDIAALLNIGDITFTGGTYNFSNTGGYTINFNGAGIIPGASTQFFVSNGSINFTSSLATTSAGDATISITGTANGSFSGGSTAGSASIDNAAVLTFTGTGTTAGTSNILNQDQLIFDAGATAGDATITSFSILNFQGSANGGTADVTNLGTVSFVAATGPVVNLGSIDNQGGIVRTGLNNIQLSDGLTLSDVDPNVLRFELLTADASGNNHGRITIDAGVGNFITSNGSGLVTVDLTSPGIAGPGTYTLIDWTGATNTGGGVDIDDFALGLVPAGLSGYLKIDGSTLQFVAVPEPSSLAMPVAGVLGMLWLRRRTARMSS